MRIGISLVVISDLVIRFGDLEAHYTDKGLWPTELIRNFGWNAGYWSLHALSGSAGLLLILFILHFIAAFSMLIGFKTRLSTLLVWLFTISLHNRNIFVLQSGDDLLRLTLLWGVFLPWGACYAIDARAASRRPKSIILANIGYLLLLASVYFFSASLKSSPEWHEESSAAYYALSLEQLRLPAGDWIYDYPYLLKVLTWLVFNSEYIVAPLILFPSKRGTYRFIAFMILLLLHLGIGLTLYVGLFFAIGIATAIGLLPAFVMDRFERFFGLKTNSKSQPAKNNSFITSAVNCACALLVILCMSVNLGTVNWFPLEMDEKLSYVSNTLRLNQYWGMFSPGVLKKDGWYVYHGMDSIGRQWDLRRNEDYVDYAKPGKIVSMYKNDRWRKLAENMQGDHYTFLRPAFCKYIIHKWNQEHPKRKMHSLSIYFMEKENLPDYKTTEPTKVFHCSCYDH